MSRSGKIKKIAADIAAATVTVLIVIILIGSKRV
jgi:hypothetical protein